MSYFRAPKTVISMNTPNDCVRDSKGTALVEFAITLPVLLILYLGCVQICEVVTVYRKATTTARTLADISTQYVALSNTEINTIMSASSQIMAPYPTSNVRMVITHVTVDSTGVATVNWSKKSANAPAADAADSIYTLPTDMNIPNTSLIIAKVNVDYSARIGGFLQTDIPLADTIYMYPRISNSIPNT
jgi:Flp pilus assembly protein TadG